MSNYLEDLKELDEQFEKASATGGSSVPDGRYIGIIKEVVFKKTKEGKLMLGWTFIVTSGEHKGRYIFKNNVISENSMSFLKTDITTCGIDIKKLSELEANLPQFINRMLELSVTIKADSQFPNVYINKYVGMGKVEDFIKAENRSNGLEDFERQEIASDEDDLPFD